MTGRREQRKQATRAALRDAALRLALEHGPDNVRVDDIAEAAGVSPRTYNNYFPSREHAIVAAITAERETQVASAVAAQPPDVRLADAVTIAVVGRLTHHDHDAMTLVTTRPALRETFIHSADALEHDLAQAITHRVGDIEPTTARVLAAGVTAAVRVALEQWLSPAGAGLVVPTGDLPSLLRDALAPLAPALDAADRRVARTGHGERGE